MNTEMIGSRCIPEVTTMTEMQQKLGPSVTQTCAELNKQGEAGSAMMSTDYLHDGRKHDMQGAVA